MGSRGAIEMKTVPLKTGDRVRVLVDKCIDRSEFGKGWLGTVTNDCAATILEIHLDRWAEPLGQWGNCFIYGLEDVVDCPEEDDRSFDLRVELLDRGMVRRVSRERLFREDIDRARGEAGRYGLPVVSDTIGEGGSTK